MGKLKTFWHDFKDWTLAIVIVLAILTGVYFGMYWQMEAYHQRFPDAAWWTFFFQGSR